MIYKFRNLNFKFQGKEYLGCGSAHYVVEEYDEGEFEAGFEQAELDQAIGYSGMVKDESIIKQMNDSVVEALNRDESLCRMIGK